MAETVTMGTGNAPAVVNGNAGLNTQVPGQATTVSGAAGATNDVGAGHFIETSIDDQLFAFQGEDTPLMSLMLKEAKKVKVDSPEVEHFMIDEQRNTFVTTSAVTKNTNANAFKLPLSSEDMNIPRDYHTLIVKGVAGYNEAGNATTPGKDLMLFVTGRDNDGCPMVRAINGPKTASTNRFCTVPAIPSGTKVVLLANALYETQKEVDPDLIVPQPSTVYLQKRGMNQVVSDYFEAQRKHIPFSQAVIAEQAILNFKRAGNRTLWAGIKGKTVVSVPKLGEQTIYMTEGLRWQFKKELKHSGKWTIEQLIALAKMFYTGEDVPKSAMLLAGKNFLENLQCIDFSKHPEISVAPFTHPTLGWEVTRIHTVFGDIDLKREPTLDTLGLSNSGALIGENRLVHYTYSTEHDFSDRVEGEEATRKGMVVWDGLALKGSCHIWIDGEDNTSGNSDAVSFVIWETNTAPTGADKVVGRVYYLTEAISAISASATAGTMWQWNGTSWVEFTGEIFAVAD